MKISDVQLGKSTIIEVSTSNGEDFGAQSTLTVVRLFSTDADEAPLLRAGDAAWHVAGTDKHHQALLDGVIARELPRLIWIVARQPKDMNEPAMLLTIEVREFPSECIWPDTTEFGVDEKILEDLRKKHKRVESIGQVTKMLDEQVLIADDSGLSITFLSGSPTPSTGKRVGFRLHGRGIAVDVLRDDDDRLLVTRVVEATSTRVVNEQRPILLVRGRLRFTDHTTAGRFRGAARAELEQIVGNAESYLGVWREYNKIERRGRLKKARDFGWLTYTSVQAQADGKWRIRIDDGVRFEECLRQLDDLEATDLEAAAAPPAELTRTDESDMPASNAKGSKKRIFAGRIVGIDRQKQHIDIQLPAGSDEDRNPPPTQGVLYLSSGGDRASQERREKAQALISAAECPMPQLGLLIEDKPVPVRRRRNEKPLSAGAREAFGGEPTGRQIEALAVALNTPDIALIQGPPGTGKTRTIAALQTRLSEISEDTHGVAGRFLLSSFQHDAVENVASATQVFGLPAVKLGRKRGLNEDLDGFERWRQDRVEAVRARLSTSDELPAAVALRKCRALAVGYLQAPSTTDDLSALLASVIAIAGAHLPPRIGDQLRDLAAQLGRRGSGAGEYDEEREQALRSVRGLRASAASFCDDGSLQAKKALRRTQQLGVLSADEAALLQRAADWESESEPGFLEELARLQMALIDRLLPDEKPMGEATVNVDVESALNLVIGSLRDKVRSTRGGVDAVLHDFCDDLDQDRTGAREAVEQYTVVLAATCQQAVGYEMNMRKNEGNVFNTVVVDEAARANPLDLFIPMSLAERRIVLVGDHRQLPHVLDQEIENDLDSDVSQKTRDMLRTSLFQRLFEQLRKRETIDGIKRTVTLDVQYRMHPVLGQFVSETFYAPYGEGFSSGQPASEFPHSLPQYGDAVAAWVNVPFGRGPEKSGQSKSRKAEAVWLAKETARLMAARPDLSFGVITFYSAQVREIQREFETLGITEQIEGGGYRICEAWRTTRDHSGKLKERLRIGTVDAFQGKEFDVVLLSVTRSNDLPADEPRQIRRKYGHLALENRLCVAMSRQQRLLIVVGDDGMLQGSQAAGAIPGLVRFWELSGGDYGVRIQS